MTAQAPIVEFLLDGASYGRGAGRVEYLSTHISHIFLVGDRAYKMKRDVAFSFLDFSSLEKRHDAALNELRINHRISAQLYLGLTAVVQGADGRLALIDDPCADTVGVVEWLVRMRRFAQSDLYSARARRGDIAPGDAVALADMVSALHRDSPVFADDEQATDDLQAVHEENVAFFRQHPGLIDATKVGAVLDGCATRLGSGRALLGERVAAGFRRHCHGDLHLGNIVTIEGRPLAFDAIEFNDRMATIDVLYDIAFLLMDLWRHGLCDRANTVLNRYLADGSGNLFALAGLELLPLFLTLRALIRLKAAVWQAEAEQADKRGASALDAKARTTAAAYAELALDFLRPRRPCLIAIGGLSGTGKSSVARAIAWRVGTPPGAVILRSDVERKALFGVEETQPLPTAAYTEEATERVYRALLDKAQVVLAAGHAAIIDAVSARPAQRAAIAALAARRDLRFHGFWLHAPSAVLLARVAARRGDASDADGAVVERQLGYDIGDVGWTEIDAAGDVAATAATLRAILDRASADA